MNKNNFLILVLGIIAALGLIGIINKKVTLTNNLNTSSLLNPKNNLSPVVMSADEAPNNTQDKTSIQNGKIDKESTERTVEVQVPWQELNEKWNEELKSFLFSINERDGRRIFNAYTEAHLRYLKEDARLGVKYQKIHSTKPLDRKKEDQLAVESSEVFKKANDENKKIFGQHYNAVKKLHKEFEESIQVYSRDMPISLDLSFDD